MWWDKNWVLAWLSFGECTVRVKLELTDLRKSNGFSFREKIWYTASFKFDKFMTTQHFFILCVTKGELEWVVQNLRNLCLDKRLFCHFFKGTSCIFLWIFLTHLNSLSELRQIVFCFFVQSTLQIKEENPITLTGFA